MKKAQLNTLATKAAVAVATVLVLGKFVAWWMTNSLSIQASLVDSLLDVGASIINLFAVKHALKPADEDHRFGHGKAEALASLGQSAFIAASALWLVIEGARRFYSPETVLISPFSNVVMIFSMVLTFSLVMFQRYVFKRTHSLAIKADSLHYKTDFLTSAAVLISLNISFSFGEIQLDSLIGIGIALYIALTSWGIFKEALDILMDRELSDAIIRDIRRIAEAHKHVVGVHDLKTRSAGHKQFIQMHLDMDARLSLIEAHNIALEVTRDLKASFPDADILIHQDPYGHDEGDFHT